MTALLQAWILFPLVLAAVSLGCGLLVERLSGLRLPGTLLLPVGFAAVITVAELVTSIPATASLSTAAVVAVALAGLALAWPDPRRPGRWVTLAALLVFAVYAAPVVLSGTATFAGYIKLDDTSTWLALADRVLEHGRTVNFAPSTYHSAIRAYIHGSGYPVGSVLPLGIGAKLTGQDALWAYQPYLAFQALLASLGLYELLAGLVRSLRLRAFVVFVAAQPALLYGYALWGSVKELVTVPLIVLVAALSLWTARREGTARGTLPLAVATAGLLGALNVGAGVWLALALAPALVLVRRVPVREFATRLGAFAAFAVVLALPTIVTASSFLGTATHSLTGGAKDKFGNLLQSLSKFQVAGIWPVGDFRLRPGDMAPTYVLIGITAAAAVVGVVLAVHRRTAGVPVYLGVSLIGAGIVFTFGSPWVDAKVLATASPALLFAGLAGAALVFEQGRRVEAVVVAAAIAAGVGWSNYLQWHAAWLAPRDQLTELQTIGNRFAGDSPALINEYQPYGARHLLRKLDPEASGELRPRLLLLRDGSVVPKGGYADIDGLRLDELLVYRTLILPRSPIESRPPSAYSLVWSGTWYDVWQRPENPQRIVDHLSLGTTQVTDAVPSCADVLRLGREATASGGSLVYVTRRPVTEALMAKIAPPSWLGHARNAHAAGTLKIQMLVPATATYRVWLDGSFAARLAISVDGHSVGAHRHRIEHIGQFIPYRTIHLTAGYHDVVLDYSGPDWHPGSAAYLGIPINRVVLARTTEDVPLHTIPAAQARSLCGRRFDWIEAVA